MKHSISTATPAIGHTLVAGALDRIERSREFRGSRRHRELLRHLVERSGAGDTAALKESVLALEVFERPLASFDPERDTIVRVEVRRLRQRLQRYYAQEGAADAVEVVLPIGSYVPVWQRREAPTDDAVERANAEWLSTLQQDAHPGEPAGVFEQRILQRVEQLLRDVQDALRHARGERLAA